MNDILVEEAALERQVSKYFILNKIKKFHIETVLRFVSFSMVAVWFNCLCVDAI